MKLHLSNTTWMKNRLYYYSVRSDFRNKVIILIVSFLVIFSCNNMIDYYKLPLYSSNNLLNVVIEIPAGTNKKYEYSNVSKRFELDQINGKNRIIHFLPYIGNYGYFPSTYSDPQQGGDGDAIDVLLLSESVSMGTIIEVIPIAILKLIDDGELDYKVIAIPADKGKQIIETRTYSDFSQNFPEVKQIIEFWFLNYNRDDIAKIEGWGDEKEAIAEISRNKIKKRN